jgi:hypothetical protein
MDDPMDTGSGRSSISLRDELNVPEVLSELEIEQIEKLYEGYSIVDYIWLENIMKFYGHFVCVQPIFIRIQIAPDRHKLDIWNYNENKVSIPDFQRMLNSCLYNDKRFIVFFLQIHPRLPTYCKDCIGCDECAGGEEGGHSNVLIVDLENQVVERYEPHGYTSQIVRDNNLNIQYNILIQQMLTAFWMQLGFSFVFHATMKHQFETCEKIRDIGYCTMFSGWYATIRLKYSHLSRQELDMRLSNKLGDYEMISYIRRYTKVILDRAREIAKEYKIEFTNVSDLNDFLIDQRVFNKLMNTMVEDPIEELDKLVLQPLSEPYVDDSDDDLED